MKFAQSTALKGACILAAASSVSAFWRMPCRYRSGLARIDPLINYGTASVHSHTIHGSNGFSETATYTDLIAGDCTSCQVSEDKSAYWTPALYFQDAATGKFEIVEQVGGMLAYYLLYPNSGNTSLSAFPEGFRMISGDTNRRNFTAGPVPDNPKSDWTAAESTQDALAQKALGFNCLNYAGTAEGSLYRHFLPDKAYLDANCTDGVRFELMFPSCWDGKNVDSTNHKDHVAFPSEVMTGDCPEGFPIRLVSLFYETIWNTAAFAGTDGQFVIANGDPTGYGYHGDFMMGWDESFLQNAVDTCTNASGQIQDCSLFTIQDGSNCNITLPSDLVSENVEGPIATLPGNPVIAYGPEPATEAVAAVGTAVSSVGSAVVPTLTFSSGSSIASSATFVPGGIFKAGASSVSTSVSLDLPTTASTSSAAPATTSAPSIEAAAAAAETFFSTAYTTSGREVLEVLWVEETVTVTEQTTSTATAYAKRSEKLRNRHLHKHLGRHA